MSQERDNCLCRPQSHSENIPISYRMFAKSTQSVVIQSVDTAQRSDAFTELNIRFDDSLHDFPNRGFGCPDLPALIEWLINHSPGDPVKPMVQLAEKQKPASAAE